MDKLDRILDAKYIRPELRARRNLDAVRELAELLQNDEAVDDPKAFVAYLIRKAQEGWASVGNGVALPHVHEEFISRERIAVGICRDGIDFGATDGQPVRIVVLVATPKKHHEQHMQLLAALARLLHQQEVRQALLEAPDAEAIIEVFRRR